MLPNCFLDSWTSFHWIGKLLERKFLVSIWSSFKEETSTISLEIWFFKVLMELVWVPTILLRASILGLRLLLLLLLLPLPPLLDWLELWRPKGEAEFGRDMSGRGGMKQG